MCKLQCLRIYRYGVCGGVSAAVWGRTEEGVERYTEIVDEMWTDKKRIVE